MRIAGADERADIVAFFDGLEAGLGDRLLADRVVGLGERDGVTAVCLLAPEAVELSVFAAADHAGLRIGTLEGDGFRLDLQGAVLLARLTSKATVRVTERAARAFLFSRPVFGDSVTAADPALGQGDACIVCNQRGEALGLARVVGRFKGPRPALVAVHDLGAYLRDQDRARGRT